jgi:hypothetical protein
MKEEEIRPEKLFSEHLRLCKQDAQTYFHEAQHDRIKCQLVILLESLHLISRALKRTLFKPK